jgi:hypothetical protein
MEVVVTTGGEEVGMGGQNGKACKRRDMETASGSVGS